MRARNRHENIHVSGPINSIFKNKNFGIFGPESVGAKKRNTKPEDPAEKIFSGMPNAKNRERQTDFIVVIFLGRTDLKTLSQDHRDCLTRGRLPDRARHANHNRLVASNHAPSKNSKNFLKN